MTSFIQSFHVLQKAITYDGFKLANNGIVDMNVDACHFSTIPVAKVSFVVPSKSRTIER